jgi:hypothetical protein
MTIQAYQRVGNTIRVTGNATPGTGNIAAFSNGFGGQSGPVFVKVDNANNTTVDAFLNFGTNSNVSATIATVGTPGTGICIQHGATEFIQVAEKNTPPTTIYFAVASASAIPVYITPVILVP